MTNNHILFIDPHGHKKTEAAIRKIMPSPKVRRGMICPDGSEKDLLECNQRTVDYLRNAEYLHPRFTVYRPNGKHGKVEIVDLDGLVTRRSVNSVDNDDRMGIGRHHD